MRRHLSSTTIVVLLLAGTVGSAQEGTAEVENTEHIPFLLDYPNLHDPDGEVLLDNEHVVVQRFVVPPGEWEGVHAHPGNQVYVHVVGGTWSGRAGGESNYDDSVSETGAVGWS